MPNFDATRAPSHSSSPKGKGGDSEEFEGRELAKTADRLMQIREGMKIGSDDATASGVEVEEESEGPVLPLQTLLDGLERQSRVSPSAATCSSAVPSAHNTVGDGDVPSLNDSEIRKNVRTLRRVRRQLECDAQGRSLQEGLSDPHYEVDAVDGDVAELKRVPGKSGGVRQNQVFLLSIDERVYGRLSYLFGGLVQSLPPQNIHALAARLNLPACRLKCRSKSPFVVDATPKGSRAKHRDLYNIRRRHAR
ncbi:unnamed protein product [Vitrella brassicaformis CCMP3155]|uniref:Uncharacterized protein n=1 Tax=Vitrella brassicaformis (strain CCMP3155) TaxID=1169540 RepID=A0A0G4GGI5_VITBC|nr:unnamed protein product [Vitrella brassicaformis CCMP3155]|eukprot:CEM28751.1 unnamed protein product [Vitrella brassicaformis CCMP3155]